MWHVATRRAPVLGAAMPSAWPAAAPGCQTQSMLGWGPPGPQLSASLAGALPPLQVISTLHNHTQELRAQGQQRPAAAGPTLPGPGAATQPQPTAAGSGTASRPATPSEQLLASVALALGSGADSLLAGASGLSGAATQSAALAAAGAAAARAAAADRHVKSAAADDPSLQLVAEKARPQWKALPAEQREQLLEHYQRTMAAAQELVDRVGAAVQEAAVAGGQTAANATGDDAAALCGAVGRRRWMLGSAWALRSGRQMQHGSEVLGSSEGPLTAHLVVAA